MDDQHEPPHETLFDPRAASLDGHNTGADAKPKPVRRLFFGGVTE